MNHSEIPDTEFGIKQYLNYCSKQIKENLNQNKRLKTRMQWCIDKAESLGIKNIGGDLEDVGQIIQ